MPEGTRSATRGVLRWAPLVVAASILLWHALQYDFVTDDAYISFVYSRNLAEHGQLVFNPGDRVEGYTNFLWTFLLGLLMLVDVPPELASRVLGVALGMGGLWMSFRIAERLLGKGHLLAGLPPILLAWSSGYACWSSGGLETQLYTFLVTGALEAYLAAEEQPRALRRMGVMLALASMTRPEGPMLVAIVGFHRLVVNLVYERRLKPNRAELAALAWFLGLWAPWFVWRWWYYGWPFPNTYYVKAAGDAVAGYETKMRRHGAHYVGRWFQQTALWWASPLALLGLLAGPRTVRFRFAVLAAAITAAYLYYAVSVGGDFMGLHRFIMPLFVIAAIVVTLGVDRLTWPLVRLPTARTVATALVALGLLVAFADHQWKLTNRSLRFGNFKNDDGIDTPAFLRVYAHDRALIGQRLRACVRPDDFAIYGGVGAMPYHAQLRGIDVFGLVSQRIAHEVPRTRDRAGHNKWGPDPLLAEYDPTIVMHCYELRRTPGVAPLSHCAGFWQARGFEKVVLHVPGLLERGEHYTFLARKDRRLECPGLGR